MTIMRMRMRIVEFLISREGASPAWDQSTGRRQLTVTHPRLALSRIVRKTKNLISKLFQFLISFFLLLTAKLKIIFKLCIPFKFQTTLVFRIHLPVTPPCLAFFDCPQNKNLMLEFQLLYHIHIYFIIQKHKQFALQIWISVWQVLQKKKVDWYVLSEASHIC